MVIYVILDLMYNLGNDWDNILELEKYQYLKDIFFKVNLEFENKVIYPKQDEILNAFKYTAYKDIKVVILGQDPYHTPGCANGLSFSVNNDIKLPPSLKNIYKELKSDLNIDNSLGNLESWAKQGVFLLNSVLTVEENIPASHKKIGWSQFSDDIIKEINQKNEPVVFILWGEFAKSKNKLITNKRHLILESSHPSPFSVNINFFGSKPFSKTNDFLKENGYKEIDWRVL